MPMLSNCINFVSFWCFHVFSFGFLPSPTRAGNGFSPPWNPTWTRSRSSIGERYMAWGIYFQGFSTIQTVVVVGDFWTINTRGNSQTRSPDVATSSARHVFVRFSAQGSAKTLQFPSTNCEFVRISHLIEASARFHSYKLNCGSTKPIYTWQKSVSWDDLKRFKILGTKQNNANAKQSQIPTPKVRQWYGNCFTQGIRGENQAQTKSRTFRSPFVSLQHLFPCSNLQCEPRRG